MRGRAARATYDIGIRLDPQGRAYSYAEVKAAYEARFITPGETQIARTGAGLARQVPIPIRPRLSNHGRPNFNGAHHPIL